MATPDRATAHCPCCLVTLHRAMARCHLDRFRCTILAPVTAGSLRLFDLVECPVPEHRVAFYSTLRDTLVCEDKKLASKIALDGQVRHRVVTTDGVVINTSGTMEGGGRPLSGEKKCMLAVWSLSGTSLYGMTPLASMKPLWLTQTATSLCRPDGWRQCGRCVE